MPINYPETVWKCFNPACPGHVWGIFHEVLASQCPLCKWWGVPTTKDEWICGMIASAHLKLSKDVCRG